MLVALPHWDNRCWWHVGNWQLAAAKCTLRFSIMGMTSPRMTDDPRAPSTKRSEIPPATTYSDGSSGSLLGIDESTAKGAIRHDATKGPTWYKSHWPAILLCSLSGSDSERIESDAIARLAGSLILAVARRYLSPSRATVQPPLPRRPNPKDQEQAHGRQRHPHENMSVSAPLGLASCGLPFG